MEKRWMVAHDALRRELLQRAHAIHNLLLRAPRPVVLTGLGCVALAASSDLANTFDAPRRGGPLIAVLLFLVLALAFVAFIAATLPPRRTSTASGRASSPSGVLRRLAPYLIYPILLWSLVTALQSPAILGRGLVRGLTQWPPSYGSDDLYYNHYNAVLVLRGENPYIGQRLLDEVRYFHALDYTPLARGRFASPHHYPSRAALDAVLHAYQAHPQTPPVEVDPRTLHSYPAGAFLVDVPPSGPAYPASPWRRSSRSWRSWD